MHEQPLELKEIEKEGDDMLPSSQVRCRTKARKGKGWFDLQPNSWPTSSTCPPILSRQLRPEIIWSRVKLHHERLIQLIFLIIIRAVFELVIGRQRAGTNANNFGLVGESVQLHEI